jgi:ParB family chromosome partitioning protein
MTKIEKIVLSQSQDIPFDKLVLSNRNVRRIQTGLSIEELAEDIATRTLLQSLSVRPLQDREGFYEVQAGGRRYRALELLVKQKRLANNAPIPCIVREDGILEEDSLAENVQRQSLHPLDQFRAFQTLREQGLCEEEIAARFFVTLQIVKQRLKLAAVSPKLLELYASDEMTLEQLVAFAISNDHDRQEQVWGTVSGGYNQQPHYIRRLLTENTVAADDKRACFIGITAYEAEGGVVLRDLFSEDDEGLLQDVALLERLVAEKLAVEAEALKAEGWKWVQVAEDFSYGHTRGMRRLIGEEEPLNGEEETLFNALTEEKEEIERQYFQDDGEDIPEDVEKRLIKIEDRLEELSDRSVRYDPAEIAMAGAFVSIGADGSLSVERGFVRGEDDKGSSPTYAQSNDAEDFCRDHICCVTVSSDHKSDAETEDEELKPLSDRLVMELTAHRTLALRDAMANDPDTAFLAVLHTLALQTFYQYATNDCLEITAKSSGFPVQGQDLKTCRSALAIEERHTQWEKQLPKEAKDLWSVLRAMDVDNRGSLFAHCASLTINAVHEPWNRAPGRKHHADRLAELLALDMAAAGWQPTAANYLGRISKVRILEAVTEAKGAAAAEWIENLRKLDMAQQAERMMTDTSWLPEPLRTPGVESVCTAEKTPTDSVPMQNDADTKLPDFLTEAA